MKNLFIIDDNGVFDMDDIRSVTIHEDTIVIRYNDEESETDFVRYSSNEAAEKSMKDIIKLFLKGTK
jgi:hypothetical protein